MELSPKCTEKLKIWLNMETWHTIDTNDMNRFFCLSMPMKKNMAAP